MLKPGKGIEGGEMAASAPKIKNVTINFAGGGGFSEIFPRPDYQKTAVATYLQANPPPYPSLLFNSTGRAYPDISANSLNLNFVTQGEIRPTGFGTSIAAPLVAGIVNRINEERLSVGKGTVGFLNPVLYANAKDGVLNDVVQGSNPGCGYVGCIFYVSIPCNCNSDLVSSVELRLEEETEVLFDTTHLCSDLVIIIFCYGANTQGRTAGFSAARGWDAATGLGTPNFEGLLRVFMALP